MQMPAPRRAIDALRDEDSGKALNIKIKLTRSPKMEGVCETA
jgi:hypothetical protein